MNILKIPQFLCGSIVNDLRNAYYINVLELFLKGNPNLLWSLFLNDWLVLIKDKFR